MKIRWFPNSWVQIISESKTIYIDPAWIQKHFVNYPGRVIYSKWPAAMDGLPDPKLAKADYILITHAHKDHYKPETIARLSSSNTKIFGPKKLAKTLPNLQIISPGDSLELEGLKIDVVYAYNTENSSSTIKQHKKGECNGAKEYKTPLFMTFHRINSLETDRPGYEIDEFRKLIEYIDSIGIQVLTFREFDTLNNIGQQSMKFLDTAPQIKIQIDIDKNSWFEKLKYLFF